MLMDDARLIGVRDRHGFWPLVLGRVDFLVFYRVRPRALRVEVLALWHSRRGQPPPPL